MFFFTFVPNLSGIHKQLCSFILAYGELAYSLTLKALEAYIKILGQRAIIIIYFYLFICIVFFPQIKKGPKLDSEILSLRGDELKHYSGSSNQVYLHV